MHDAVDRLEARREERRRRQQPDVQVGARPLDPHAIGAGHQAHQGVHGAGYGIGQDVPPGDELSFQDTGGFHIEVVQGFGDVPGELE